MNDSSLSTTNDDSRLGDQYAPNEASTIQQCPDYQSHRQPSEELKSSSISGEQVEQLLEQLNKATEQREQLAKIEAELSMRIEKLNGQRKSLSRRFRAEWKKLKAAKMELLKETSDHRDSAGSDPAEINSYTKQTRKIAQSSSLIANLAKQQTESSGGGSNNAENQNPSEAVEIRQDEMFEIKRELERALDELHEVRSENARLKLASQPTADSSSQGSNWEEMKKALINDLEEDSNTDSADAAQLADAVRHSRQLLHQKDEKIKRLEAVVRTIKKVAYDDAREAKRKILDENEVVAYELNRLTQLQLHWREKIGQAEIELSQERARLARDRTELDELMEEFEELQEAAENPETPRGRKWREHLGLD